MFKNNKKRKTIALSIGLAAMTMLLPQTATAQYDESRYGLQPWFGSSMLGKENSNREGESYSFTNGGFGEKEPEYPETPLGSGIAILIGAGLGYVALKKKEDKQ